MILLTGTGDLYSFNTDSRIIKLMNKTVFQEPKKPLI